MSKGPAPITATTPRFIVGMPRAATTWLCKCLNEHSQAVAFGETSMWGRRYPTPDEDGRYGPKQLATLFDRHRILGWVRPMSGDGPGCLRVIREESFHEVIERVETRLPERPTPAETFATLIAAIGEAEGKPVVIEKTPHHLNWIDRILTALPDARFVVMLREPYGFMLSYKHQGDRLPTEQRVRFRRRYHPLLPALVWRSYMLGALAAQRRHGDQVLLVRREDILSDPESRLAEIQAFLGLDHEHLADRVPADNTSFTGEARPSLRGDDRFWMRRVAGRVIRDSGFEHESGRVEIGRILLSMLRLPIWAVWNFLNFRKFVSGSFLGYLWRWLRPGRSG